MIKLVRTSDTLWNDKVSTLLKVTKFGAEFDGLVKTAGAVLAKEFRELEPSEKYAWVHTLAIGAFEKYSINRNGDGFEAKWLRSNHPHFTKHANLFRNHQNKDPKKAIGVIKHSAYNEEMGRLELIVGYDKEKASDIVEKIASGEDVAGSMGTRVDFDTCLICQHKAPSPKHYCFIPGTQITMADGTLRNIEEVREGDMVLDKDGAETPVVACLSRSVDEDLVTYRNTFNGFTTVATAEHPIWTAPAEHGVCLFRKHDNPASPTCWRGTLPECTTCRARPLEFSFARAGSLRNGDYVSSPIPYFTDSTSNDLSHEDCWVLGLFTAEGSYGKQEGIRSSLQFSLHEDETEFIERLRAYFKSKYAKELKVYTRAGSKGVSVRVHSQEISSWFFAQCGEYAHAKTVPPAIFSARDEAVDAFLQGLFDGDGCYYGESSRLNTASRNLANQVALLCSRLGYNSYVSKFLNAGGPTARSNTHDGWYVATSFRAKTTNSAKSTHRLVTDGATLGCVFSVGKVAYAGAVYNLETGSHTYVANGAAVHNCDHLKNAMCQILDDGRVVGCLNPDPHFFDWSYVGRPADRIAFGFESKVASAETWLSGYELAKEANLWLPSSIAALEGQERKQLKISMLAKLAEMEKEVPTKLTTIDKKISDSTTDSALDEGTVGKLKRADLSETMGAMHEAKVILPIKDFIKLISNQSGENIDDIGDDAQQALPGIFGRMHEDGEDCCCENSCFDGASEPGGPIKDLIQQLIPALGLGEIPLGRRITISVIRGPRKVASAVTKNPLPEIETLARLYATYKLASLTHPRNEHDVMLTRAALLQNYHHQV